MGMGPIPRWAKGALQIPAADLRPSSRKSDNILRCIWPGPTTNGNTGRSIEWPISLPPAIPTFDPLPTIVDHCPALATLIAVISRKYVKAIFYTLCSQQQGTINNRNDCKYSVKNISLPAFFLIIRKCKYFPAVWSRWAIGWPIRPEGAAWILKFCFQGEEKSHHTS